MKNIIKKPLVFLIFVLLFSLSVSGCSILGLGSTLWVDVSGAKTEIEQGEEFDFSALKVYLEKLSGRTLLDNSLITFGEVDITTVGSQRISVEYENLKTFFTVTVTQPEVGSITLDQTTLPQKTIVGNDFDFSSIKGSITLAGAIVELQGSQFTFDGFDKNLVGDQEITVTYKQGYKVYTATFVLTVYEDIKELRVDLSQMKKTYQYFDFDWSSVCVYFYDCGDITNLDYGEFTHTAIDVMTAGRKRVDLAYDGYETYFEVEVLASTAYLELDLSQVKKVVLLNEPFDISPLKITFFIATGEEGVQIPLSDPELTITQVDTSVLGEVTVKITYKQLFETSFVVKVADKYTVTFTYLKDGQQVTRDVDVEKDGVISPLADVTTTDDLFFVGWYKTGENEPYDFENKVQGNFTLVAKFFTKQEYISNLVEKMQEKIDQLVLSKTGKVDYRLTYLESDYRDILLALISKYTEYMTAKQTWSQYDDSFKAFEEELLRVSLDLKTALQRVEEYKQSLDFSLLSEESKNEVERLFVWTIEMMTDYDGGAPNLDYLFYQLQLQVSFYFD